MTIGSISLRPCRWVVALSIVLILHVIGCGDDNQPVDPVPVERTSSLQGQVEEGVGFTGAPGIQVAAGYVGALPTRFPTHIRDAIITVRRISGAGTFENVTRDTALTNIGGEFVVSTTVVDEVDLVVQAEKGMVRYRAVVTRSVVEDSTITVAPLNYQTTAIADAWARIQAGPDTPGISRISIGLFINATVAALVATFPTYLDKTISPLIGEGVAHRAVLTHPSFGVGSATLAGIESRRRIAAIALEEGLGPVSENEPGTRAAWESFFAAEREAHVAEGTPLFQLAVAREASSRELVRRGAAIPSDLQRGMAGAAGMQRARTTAAAVQRTLIGTGAPNSTLTAIVTAGNQLLAPLRTSPSASDLFIRNQFTAYGANVRTALKAGFPSFSTAIQAAHDLLVVPGGAQGTLMVSLSAATSAEAVAAAYVAYAVEAESAARTILNASSLSEADRAPLARVLMMLAMAV